MTAREAHTEATPGRISARARDYFALTKPKVVSLIMFTAIVGMFLAVPGFPPAAALAWGTIGIALAASSAAAINHVLDARIDAEMARTRLRPLPRGTVSEAYALSFAFVLGAGSMLILALLVNALTAVLTFLSIIGYAIVYTVWLKRATPQNIVIGGAAGAAPPVLGWTAVTGAVAPDALLLFLIIFAWTPPHFWALAIARRDEYARVGIPMLPVTHGIAYTKQFIWYYTVLLTVITVLPFLTGMAGIFYLAVGARARRAVHAEGLAVAEVGPGRPADADVPVLHQLPGAPVRGTAARPLPAARAVLGQGKHHALGRTPAKQQHRGPARHARQPRRSRRRRPRHARDRAAGDVPRRRPDADPAGRGQRAGANDERTVRGNAEEAERRAFVADDACGDRRSLDTSSSPKWAAQYQTPTLVLFREAVESGCGVADSGVGPFYCPPDRRRLPRHDASSTKWRPSSRPAATSPTPTSWRTKSATTCRTGSGFPTRVHEMRQRVSEAEGNQLSVRLELQADCYAGLFGNYAKARA